MSFLSEKIVRNAWKPVTARSQWEVQTPRRSFSAAIALRKSPSETVKDGFKSLDRSVSDNVAIPVLDAAAKAKEKMQTAPTGEVKSQAKGKAEEIKGQAKGAAFEAKGKAQGVASEAKGKVDGAASEIKGKL